MSTFKFVLSVIMLTAALTFTFVSGLSFYFAPCENISHMFWMQAPARCIGYL